MIDYSKEFNCDTTSKIVFGECVSTLFNDKIHIEFTPNTTDGLDAFATATTKSHITYAFELKERDYPYDAFDEWMLEPKKKFELDMANRQGYKEMYVNLWDQGNDIWHIAIWDIKKTPPKKQQTFKTNRQTVHPEKGKVNRQRYLLPITDAVIDIVYDRNKRQIIKRYDS